MKRLVPYLFWFWILFITWMAMRAGTPGTGPGSEKYIFSIRLDYWKHLGAFGLLGLAYFGTRPWLFREKMYKPLLVGFALLAGYGLGLELIQFFVPGRAFNPLDILFNMIGLLGGGIACYIYYIPMKGRFFNE